ncbi:hypothetical protein [Streptomyces sp. NPDC057702]|uniref:hypothetical protein n=1 Tax=Streptomyces sp. NPDC057702 TaxID=3346221 RepID=UPI0036B686D8
MQWKRKEPESTPSAPIGEPAAGALEDLDTTVAALRDQLDHPTAGLTAIRQRLDHPTDGMAALYGQVTQSRLKVLEVVQAGVSGLREENRELRRRQDKMIGDLAETRAEARQVTAALGQILDRNDGLRPTRDDGDSDAAAPPEELAEEHDFWTPAPARELSTDAAPHHEHANIDTAGPQGETLTDPQPTAAQPATASRADDSALKEAVEAAYRGMTLPTQAPHTTPAAPARRDPGIQHGVLLLTAAGVASAELVTHRDTWEWIAALASGHAHFRAPAAIEEVDDGREEGREGRVKTTLSGRSLIALLIELWKTRHSSALAEADWALAVTTYDRIAARLADVTEHSQHGALIRIVLDDGLPKATD